MHIVRYRRLDSPDALVGVIDAGELCSLSGVSALGELWSMRLEELRALLDTAGRGAAEPPGTYRLLTPVDGRTEVWASGVTYEISREARVEESEGAARLYEQVYEAERPELFFKSVAWKVSGDGEAIAIREDSTLDVPEPEAALVVNPYGEVLGYTACNDVSSRSIEGENPLYLPQAKIFLGGCALGPSVRPTWEIPHPYELTIECTIERSGSVVFTGRDSTSRLRRRFEELVAYLFRADVHPEGVVLSTGTCIVPEAPFSLEDGDVVRVGVEGVGTLTTPVVRGLAAIVATSEVAARSAGADMSAAS
jgi:2-dehydro-3-deoxy-D-arabinonate dehydratase